MDSCTLDYLYTEVSNQDAENTIMLENLLDDDPYPNGGEMDFQGLMDDVLPSNVTENALTRLPNEDKDDFDLLNLGNVVNLDCDPLSAIYDCFNWPLMDLSLDTGPISAGKALDTASRNSSDFTSGRTISLEDIFIEESAKEHPQTAPDEFDGKGGTKSVYMQSFLSGDTSSKLERKPQETTISTVFSVPIRAVQRNANATKETASDIQVNQSLSQLPSCRQRYSDGARLSKYCHVCGRSSSNVSMLACHFSQKNLCRKVVCQLCVSKYDAFYTEQVQKTGNDWCCTHCRGMCPRRARCVQYYRNNQKRRIRNLARRIGKGVPEEAPKEKIRVDGVPNRGNGFSPTAVPEGIFKQ